MLTLYSENLTEKGKLDYLVVDERVILKWIKKKWVQGVDQIYLVQ